jgi:hypothetical protein
LVLTALVLFCCNTISSDVPRTPATPPAVETNVDSAARSSLATGAGKPDAPTAKTVDSSSKIELDPGSGKGASASAVQPALRSPVKPAITESYETPRQKKIWFGLMALSHGAAAFDAWTTRRAVNGGYGVEGDPLQRPFANSGAIYATTQITPLIMDYLGHRMMRSEHPLIRSAWWVPQAASASVSLGAGIHNYSVVP